MFILFGYNTLVQVCIFSCLTGCSASWISHTKRTLHFWKLRGRGEVDSTGRLFEKSSYHYHQIMGFWIVTFEWYMFSDIIAGRNMFRKWSQDWQSCHSENRISGNLRKKSCLQIQPSRARYDTHITILKV